MRRPPEIATLVLGLTWGILTMAGCGSAPEGTPAGGGSGSADGHTASTETWPLESWEVVRIGGHRAGYQMLSVEMVEREGERRLEAEFQGQFKTRRFGQEIETAMRYDWTMLPEGDLLRIEGQLPLAETPLEVDGEVVDRELRLTTRNGSEETTSVFACPAGTKGPMAVVLSLWHDPIRPGETREVTYFEAATLRMAVSRIEAKEYEELSLLEGRSRRLLRVESDTTIQGTNLPRMQDTLWVAGDGTVWKTRSDVGIVMETYRTSREDALAGVSTIDPTSDLALDVAVPLDVAMVAPTRTARAVFLVTLREGDPVAAFPTTASQTVERIDAHRARVVVREVTPTSSGGSEASGLSPAGEADRRPSLLIQSEAPRIGEMVDEAMSDSGLPSPDEGAVQDDWARAIAMERYVRDYMVEADYGAALAPALEVAQRRRGDCTEFSVLLCSLLRAAGLPARVAIGLVYHEGKLVYHMWTLVWINQRWVGLDATLAKGRVPADRLLVSSSSLASDSSHAAMLPLLQVLGRLDVRLLEQVMRQNGNSDFHDESRPVDVDRPGGQ